MKQTFNKAEAGSDADNDIDFRKLLYYALDHKWILLGCLAATLLLGVLYILNTPKTYTATAVVQVEQEESKFVNIEDVNSEDLKQAEVLKTIETNLTSSQLLLGVINTLKLTPANLGLKPKKDGTQYTDAEKVLAFAGSVSAKLVRGTRLINISANSTDPTLAQQIADEIPRQYAVINTEQRAGLSSEANKFLLEECDVLKHQVQIAEQEAQDFKDQHPGVALENSQAFYDDKLLALDGKLNDAKERLFKLQSDAAQVQRILSSPGNPDKTSQLLNISSVSGDPNVLQMQNSLATAQAALAQIAKRYRPKHPNYIQAAAQVAQMQSALARAVSQAAEGVSTGAASAEQTEGNFENEVRILEKAKLANDKVAIPYNALRKEVDANQELYDEVRMRLKETEVTRDIGSNEIRVATPAMLPLTPSKPKKMLVLLASVFGGIALGCCVSFGMSVVDTSFNSVDEAERALGLPALASIQQIKKTGEKRFLITDEPDGAIAEAFRTLRVSLSIESGEMERNIVLFTSAVPGEGKSFCAVNYAISLAQLGEPTLLIDADLRLPTVAETLLGVRPKLGLNTVLSGESTLDEATREIPSIPNLNILPSGGRIKNPAELLAGPGLRNMIKEAAGKFHWIVIDSPPVHAVSDTMLLVKHAKSICFVIHAGKTPSRVVQRACELIEKAKARPSGIVLNHISRHNHSYYYYYSGDYGKAVYGTAKSV